MSTFFVTGTDTGCGKTAVTAALLRACAADGLRACGMKPIATGAEPDAAGRRVNEDVEALREASNVDIGDALRNVYLFEPPTSPNIAASEAAATITLEPILDALTACQAAADCVVVEGVGGWLVPLSDTLTVEDLALALDVPVILVVGLRLGCINHAALTAARMAAAGVSVAGWIANRIETELHAPQAVLTAVQRAVPFPYWGVLDYAPDGAVVLSETVSDHFLACARQRTAAP